MLVELLNNKELFDDDSAGCFKGGSSARSEPIRVLKTDASPRAGQKSQ